jgi:hypothetical protein
MRKIWWMGEITEGREPMRLDHRGGRGLGEDALMQHSAGGDATPGGKQTATR